MSYLRAQIPSEDFALAAAVTIAGVTAGGMVSVLMLLPAPIIAAAILVLAAHRAQHQALAAAEMSGREAIAEKLSEAREQVQDLEIQSAAVEEVEKLLRRR
jgi:hypothetical protein